MKSIEFNTNPSFLYKLNEAEVEVDTTFVPIFRMKQQYHAIFRKYPVNKQLRYSDEFIRTAIKFGMILMIQYRGDKDDLLQGHSRVIYPMVLGRSSKFKTLLRGYHLKGWSVTYSKEIDKVWRMFRADRILSVSFTGSFFRLPPKGYNMNDRGMKKGIIQAADFNVIKRNQNILLQSKQIENREESEFDKIDQIDISPTQETLNLMKPFENEILTDQLKFITKLTFLRKVNTNDILCVVGATGKEGSNVKVYSEKKYIGIFFVEKAITGGILTKNIIRHIKGKYEFPIFMYQSKR